MVTYSRLKFGNQRDKELMPVPIIPNDLED